MPVDTMDSTALTAEQIAMYSASSSTGGGMMVVVYLAIYIITAYSLFTIAKKLGEQYTWMAWVPVLNLVLMLRMAKMSMWWILGMFVPLFNIYVIAKMYHNAISKRTGHGGWWTAGLFFFNLILLPITAYTFKPTEASATPSV